MGSKGLCAILEFQAQAHAQGRCGVTYTQCVAISRRHGRRYEGRAYSHRDVIGNLEVVHIGEDIRVYDLKQVAGDREKERVVTIATVDVLIIFGRLHAYVGGVPGIIDGAETLEILLELQVVAAASDDYAPVNGQFPDLVIVDLAQSGKQQGIERSLLRIRPIIWLVTDYSIHQ